MAGIYSDDIFKEQNQSIEQKIIAAHASKNDALIDQYNIEAIVKFVEDKLSDLSITYSKSTLSQLRCLLGTVFMSGINWRYPGCQYQEISPLYQAILDSDNPSATVGEPTGA